MYKKLTKDEEKILNNITKYEKFKILCRTNNLDIEELSINIYKKIRESNTKELEEYLGISAYQDEYMDIYDVHTLYIDKYIMNNIKNKINEKEKELLKLAIKYNIESISIKQL